MSTPAFTGLFTSESVSSGHPDKVADLISDTVLDATLAQDPHARVAVETLVKDEKVVLAGEITAAAKIDAESLVREAVRSIGYTDPANPFHADRLQVINLLGNQSPDIARGVGAGLDQGAGDQGHVFGFACRETLELLPLPISLAHALTRTLERFRQEGRESWLRPDAKTQVTVRYEKGRPIAVTDVVVSTQHAAGKAQAEIRDWVKSVLLPAALGPWNRPEIVTYVNPTGEFVIGGPVGDCGLTGRKIIVDTYGGYARHGGGAFSGKDPSKVDRSAAYFARWVARQIVQEGIAATAEVQIAYAIGIARPVAWHVDTRGTGDDALAAKFAAGFDGRPGAIIERFDLLRPLYTRTTNHGHFGKPDLPWET